MAKRPKRGFREYVKNPELFQEEAQEIDRADASPAPGDDRLGTLIAGMYLSRPEYEDLQRLRKAGRMAVPLLVAALRDPKFIFHRYGESVLDGSAMESAFD